MNRSITSITRYPILKLLFVIIPLFITSCDDDDDQGQNTNAQNIEQIRNNMTSGTWRITLYNDSGVDETGNYNDYTFTFNGNGTMVGENGTESFNGSWSVTENSNSQDDNSNNMQNDIDFNIAFSTPEILMELTDDWDIDSYTSTRIELFDISGGDGTTDLLTFQKN